MKQRLACLLTLAGCSLLRADEGAKPAGGAQAPIQIGAPPTPLDGRPRTLPEGKQRSSSGVVHSDPNWGGVRAIEIRDGEARLALAGGERTLHVRDAVAGDTVKVVEPGRVVFSRPGPEGAPPSIVIVRFDEKGRGHVTVYGAHDTSSAAPPPPSRE